jgi:hypothetical protein
MTISITRYVNIVSSVGAGTTVPRRNLKGRIFTQNELVPTGSFITFTSAADVGAWFGISSDEYARALYYFGWVSKNGNMPKQVDFARWNDVATAPEIFGNTKAFSDGAYVPQNTALYTGISAGSLGLTMGGITANLSGMDFTAITTLADVAAVVAAAINAEGSFTLTGTTNTTTLVTMASTAGLAVGMSVLAADILQGTSIVSIVPNVSITLSQAATGSNVGETITFNNAQWGLATVAYDSVRGSFQLVGGAVGVADISATDGTGGTPIGKLIGWVQGAFLIYSDGAAAQTAVEAFIASASANNDFGSFLYMNTLADSDVIDIATQNQTYNVMFMFLLAVLDQTAANTAVTNIGAISGTGITLAPLVAEYPEQFPMMILAATDYTVTNSVQNYMFQVSNLTPSVTTDAEANIYDDLKVNYYGVTQTAGTLLAFYQRGSMMGLPNTPTTMNVYANEIWLKDAAQSALMTLLLSQARVPANAQGRSLILAVIQSVIEEATNNGTISANKTLTPSQIAFITSTTGDDTAWYQVQTIGYWVNCEIVPYTVGPDTFYKAVYTLIYSKDDVINLITGEHVLI